MALIRLIKVAKELNVGTSTLVDHLIKNGFEIENKPTSKVSEEMYNVLLKDFSKSIETKKQANNLTIGSRQRKEAEQAEKDKLRVAKEAERLAKEAERLALEKQKLEMLERRRKEEALKLAELERKRLEEAAKKREENKLSGLKIVTKVELDKNDNVVQPKVETIPTPEVKPEVFGKIREASTDNTPPPPLENTPVEEGEGTFRAITPSLKGLKIQGKINIDQFNKKPKKKKLTRKEEEAAKPKAAPISESADKKRRRDRDRRNDKVSDFDALAEPRKEEDDRPKPVASSSDDNNNQKRKRKKIIKPTTIRPEDKPSQQNQQNREGEGGYHRGHDNRPPMGADARPPRPVNETGGDRGANGNNTPNVGGGTGDAGGDRGMRRRRGDKRPPVVNAAPPSNEPKEVSKKEIEDKIKATMARMVGGGKNKRSKLRRDNRERMREKEAQKEADDQNDKLQVTEFISVSELASVMDVPVTKVITTCLNLGVIVSINQRLDSEIIELVAEEFGHEVEFISVEEQSEEEEEIIDDPKDLVERAPIVTVMGHVDHGKTSLLDYIRSAKVAEGEAGGITQHIGAYEVEVGEGAKKVTFLDTPGHEAFTAMRARGAKATDIAIIIISADDKVMPQTKEAISHAQAADVPMVFAINKIDKPGASAERIKQELADMNLLVEEWGGKYQSADISAKTGIGIDDLLEKVVLEAEMLELKANPSRDASGVVLEASLDKGRGYVTKLLVQNGTLSIKDAIVAGSYAGRIKAMFNEKGKRVKKVGPASPVLVLGLSGAPQAGEKFKVFINEQDAKNVANRRAQISREQQQRATKRITLDTITDRLKLGNFKQLNLIVKGDVDGSIEALSDSLLKQSVETVQVKVLHRAVGQITESDVLLASASDAIIIGFQVRPSGNAKLIAEREGVEIKMYSVIYDAIDDVRSAIEGLLEPKEEEREQAEVEVREIYKISKLGTIAGCYVKSGKLQKNSRIRIIRQGIVVYPKKEGTIGELSSLKRFKDDMSEVKFGYECGLMIKNFNDILPGDTIEAYEVVEVKQKLSNQNKVTTA
jgi:translation initiation factor IF-2